MTVIVVRTDYNPATKRYANTIPIARVTHARPHGRPRNVGKKMKYRRLP